MTRPQPPQPPEVETSIRVRTASNKRKALRQYEELARAGQVEAALVIARLTHDRGIEVLSQGMPLEEMAQTLYAAAAALADLKRRGLHLGAAGLTPPPPAQEPASDPPAQEPPRTIADAWAIFESSVIPAEAGDVQRTEMKRCYYAGAHTFFGLLLTMLESGEEPTPTDLDTLDSLKAELDQFTTAVREGRA